MKRVITCIVVWCVLWMAPTVCSAADEAATWSFAVGEHATVPKSITVPRGRRQIVVDLSALPKGASVFRAVLRVSVRRPGWNNETSRVVVTATEAPEVPLPLLPPRYNALDATAPVVAAVKAGKHKLELLPKSLRNWRPEHTRLDVSFTGGVAKNTIPEVTKLAARHRSGQTLLTWTEPEPVVKSETLTIKEWKELRKNLAKDPRRISYRVYRSSKPVTAAAIANAELVDEVGRWTCWNPEFHGIYPSPTQKLLRYVVADGKPPVPPGTGICAYNPPPVYEDPDTRKKERVQKACYAVTVVVNGEEDLTAFAKGNAPVAAVDEKSGPGDPVLQRIEKPKKFFYTDGITLYYYTRWEAPPRCNLPSRPYDYVVTIPEKMQKPAPTPGTVGRTSAAASASRRTRSRTTGGRPTTRTAARSRRGPTASAATSPPSACWCSSTGSAQSGRWTRRGSV